MTNPFPGMNPYLESPAQWEMFQNVFITAGVEQLNHRLPDDFVARIRIRRYTTEPNRFLPEVAVLWRPTGRTVMEGEKTGGDAGVLDAPFHVETLSVEMRESYIEIVAVRQEGRVVTGIELLSLSNKENGRGREEYLRKQRDLLASDIHFLEIDLLRGGTYTVGADRTSVAVVAGLWNYIVSLHRAGAGNHFDVWTRDLRVRLPRLGVPLTEGFDAVPFDLQAVVNRAYDMGAFGRAIDYRADPTPALPDYHRDWSDRLLREAGLR